MKKSHILAILIIAVSIGIIVSSLSSTGSYATFSQAFDQEGEKFTVVGNLLKDKEMEYNPEVNANLFTFYMKDKDGVEKKVFLNQSKPHDFERSEDIVVKGSAKGDAFYATSVLLKCPSKYKEQQEFSTKNS
ncbi:cytochrome c maturation protein CcmE [Flexithrix dorotheae]|uniref:cytochrome c maturation protein CcmE domain-containing protein n=1 Tax=Flexithrix dorotheae TaxID=70993 RepID=UPI00038033D6|nr:cytochrome c maturation protein CcmE [Flexithrix dorotheae]